MKILKLFLAAAILSPSVALADKSSAPPIPRIRFLDTTLSNGLRVLISEDRFAPIFSIALTFAAGSANEEPGKTGSAHLLERLMYEGSERVGSGEYRYRMLFDGIASGSSTTPDYTQFGATLPMDRLELALFLESDRMRSLVISEKGLEAQRAAILDELARAESQPYGRTPWTLFKLAYGNFAYGHSLLGTPEDLQRTTVAELEKFYRTGYAPNRAVLSLVGNLSAADALSRVRAWFGGIQPQPQLQSPDPPPARDEREQRDTIKDSNARETRIDIAYKIPAVNTNDGQTMAILHLLLADDDTSRLRRRLMIEEKLASAMSGRIRSQRRMSLYHLTITLQPGKSPEQVEALIENEIERLGRGTITPEELDRAKFAARRQAVADRERSR